MPLQGQNAALEESQAPEAAMGRAEASGSFQADCTHAVHGIHVSSCQAIGYRTKQSHWCSVRTGPLRIHFSPPPQQVLSKFDI